MLKLISYQKSDAAHLIKWLKNETVFRYWCADHYEKFPITADEINAFYDSWSENIYVFTAVDNENIIGHITMRYMDKEKTELRFGFILVDDEKRGMGYGKKMLTLAIAHAFEMLGAKKITIGVFENNTTALGLYQKLGFTPTGEVKEYCFFDQTWKYPILEMEKST